MRVLTPPTQGRILQQESQHKRWPLGGLDSSRNQRFKAINSKFAVAAVFSTIGSLYVVNNSVGCGALSERESRDMRHYSPYCNPLLGAKRCSLRPPEVNSTPLSVRVRIPADLSSMAARNRACNTLALLLLGIVTSNASSIAADIGTGASDGPCAAEEAACPEGSVCMDCFDYLEPAASCPNTSSEDSTCEEMEESICCFASSSADCLSDDAFMNWLGELGELGPSVLWVMLEGIGSSLTVMSELTRPRLDSSSKPWYTRPLRVSRS